MSEERLKDVNIYNFNDENYVSLQDYVKLQQRIDKAIRYIKENVRDYWTIAGTNIIWEIEQILKGDEINGTKIKYRN